MISSKTTDYTDRTVDLELLQTTVNPEGAIPVSISLVSTTPRIVTGIQKLVQKYALHFLTLTGDIEFDKIIGTNFIRDVANGRIVDYGQLFIAFSVANAKTIAFLSENADSNPTDEQIASAELEDFDLNFVTSFLFMKIKITTKAGETISFVNPVNIPRA